MYFYGVGGGGVGDVLFLKMRGGGFVLLPRVSTFRGCLPTAIALASSAALALAPALASARRPPSSRPLPSASPTAFSKFALKPPASSPALLSSLSLSATCPSSPAALLSRSASFAPSPAIRARSA